MASLYIAEGSDLQDDTTGAMVPVMRQPPVATQKVTFTTTTQSAAFKGTILRVLADADCHLAFGSNPTATTSFPKYMAGVEYFMGVNVGDKVAAVTAS